jgi:hypothetical protein
LRTPHSSGFARLISGAFTKASTIEAILDLVKNSPFLIWKMVLDESVEKEFLI